MFWIIIGLMLAAAILFVAAPLYRAQQKLSATAAASAVVIAALSAVIYAQIGSPNLEPEPLHPDTPDMNEMVTALANRLSENPDDLPGWRMLGRTYMQLGNPAGAAGAFEKVMELESGENGQTMADLGEALFFANGQALTGRAGQLFENAVAIAPNNQKALFYSGMAAVERGDNLLAADRWEALLATSPPPNVADILRQRIGELRGSEPEVPVPVPASSAPLTAQVALGPAAAAAGLPDAIVFVIVRDPAQPAPPIAALRRNLQDLPAEIEIRDSDAMIAGRVPSAFQQLEVVARVSLSGQPMEQSGDWFGSALVDTTAAKTVDIVIDQQVP